MNPYPKRQPGFFSAFAHAWAGLLHAVVHQRNMKIHLLAAVLVSLVGSGLPLGLAEKVTLIFCVLLIFFAEILNSALESLVDLHIRDFDEQARITKDAAAAGVLVLAVGTVVIFAALLVHNWQTVVQRGHAIVRQVALGVPLTVCTGMLLRRKLRPLALDLLWFAAAVALWALLLIRTQSIVFSAMTLGLLILSLAAAFERRRLAQP